MHGQRTHHRASEIAIEADETHASRKPFASVGKSAVNGFDQAVFSMAPLRSGSEPRVVSRGHHHLLEGSVLRVVPTFL